MELSKKYKDPEVKEYLRVKLLELNATIPQDIDSYGNFNSKFDKFQKINYAIKEKITEFNFAFRIALPYTMCPGDFVLSLLLILKSGRIVSRPIAIKLTRRKPLPSSVYLHHIPDVVQEKPTYSGAAIASVLKSMNGDSMSSQKCIREMVDAVRDLSGYEPFQTWRIILRRVLTSQAQNVQELPELTNTKTLKSQ